MEAEEVLQVGRSEDIPVVLVGAERALKRLNELHDVSSYYFKRC